jgi:hypothetical protein
MSADRDVTRIVRSWLHEDAYEDADRILNLVLDEIDTTPQRRAGWLARRFPLMNSNFVRVALAAAAVVIIAVVGYQFLGNANTGGPGATETPAQPTKPSVGPLNAGTYTYYDIEGTGINATFTVPGGWAWNEWLVNTDGGNPPGGASVQFWAGDIQVYTDPCHWTGAEPTPPTGSSVDDLITALAAQPMRDASTPVDITVGTHSGKAVDLTVPADMNFGDCDQSEFRSWLADSGERYHQAAGQRDAIWAVDVDGTRIVLDSFVYPGTSAATATELQAILGSLLLSR